MNHAQLAEIADKEYRHGLVAAQIEIDLPLQIRALRKERKLTQPELAELTGMKQSRFSLMEKPGGARFTIETLRRLAEAFDVALIVRFAPFSELLAWSERFSPDEFVVPSFPDEFQNLNIHGNVEQPIGVERMMRMVEQAQGLRGAGQAQVPTPIASSPGFAQSALYAGSSSGHAGAEGQASRAQAQ